MTDWNALTTLATCVDGGAIICRPGDVPVFTVTGNVEVCAETDGYDVWIIGQAKDNSIAGDGLQLVATGVSQEVAIAYLKQNATDKAV